MASRSAPKIKQMSSDELRKLSAQNNKYSHKAREELQRRNHPIEVAE